jgi:hypothetical protein
MPNLTDLQKFYLKDLLESNRFKKELMDFNLRKI